MKPRMTPRLARVTIDGLFGQFSYDIPLNVDERITAIIGPNGSGKTVCLKLIEGLFRRWFGRFLAVQFDKIEFHFTNDESVVVEQVDDKEFDRKEHEYPVLYEEWETNYVEDYWGKKLPLTMTLKKNGETVSWRPKLSAEGAKAYVDFLNSDVLPWHLRQIGLFSWESIDPDFAHRQGLVPHLNAHIPPRLTLRDVVSIYLNITPDEFFVGVLGEFSHTDVDILKDRELYSEASGRMHRVLSSISCHLIESQRLLVFPSGGRQSSRRVSDAGEQALARQFAIQTIAEKLKKMLEAGLNHYAAVSQSLDRRFPGRVIERPETPRLSPDELRSQLQLLEEKRSALMDAGILSAELEKMPIPEEVAIDDGVLKVLEIYIEDTTTKLAVFDELLPKIALFKELVNKTFQRKEIHISRESGFLFRQEEGKEIPLRALSSGEQHELIILFQLMFEARENSLFLIDEPEISFDVSWQKRFITDIKRIMQFNPCDVVLATHSPQVIARHLRLVVELGDVEE